MQNLLHLRAIQAVAQFVRERPFRVLSLQAGPFRRRVLFIGTLRKHQRRGLPVNPDLRQHAGFLQLLHVLEDGVTLNAGQPHHVIHGDVFRVPERPSVFAVAHIKLTPFAALHRKEDAGNQSDTENSRSEEGNPA